MASLISFLKKHWGKLILIAVFGKSLLGLSFLLIGLVISQFNEKFYDETSIVNSVHLGREIKIAPFALLVKMKKYGGWKDKYLYIFATAPEYDPRSGPESIEKLSDYAVFKVIDVQIMTGSFLGGGGGIVCIMKNMNNSNQIASQYCDDLDALEELTEFFYEAESDIQKSGRAYVSSEKRGPSPFNKILDVNTFSVYQISSKQELTNFLIGDLGSLGEYKYVMGIREPYLLKKDELHDERKIAQLLKITGFGETWESKRFGNTKLNEYLNKNRIPDEVEKWILGNYSKLQDRWVLRTLTSFLQRMILNQQIMNLYDAKTSLALFEEVTMCLRVHFDDYSNFNDHIEKLKNKFLQNPGRLLKYENVLDLSSDLTLKEFKYYPNGCHNFSPPKWVSEV